MKRILIVSDYAYAGGAEIIMQNIVSYLSEKCNEEGKLEYDISIGTLYDEKENIEKYYPPSVKYYDFSKISVDPKYNNYKKLDPRRICAAIIRRVYKKKYLEYISSRNYDIVIAMKEGDVMALLQDVEAKKKIGWIHVDFNYLHWTAGLYGSKEVELECMKKYDHIVCVSKATRDSVCSIVGDPGNLVVRENPIDVERILKLSKKEIEYKRNILKNRKKSADIHDDVDKDIQDDKTILVSVGRLCEHKNYMPLLKSIFKAKSVVGDNFELWIIGDGEDRARLEAYVEEYNLDNVKFLGSKDNPYPYIKKADWFVTTTKGESYGLAVQEALILGVPVLATRCMAFEECMSSSEAILVDNTEDDIYAGIIKVLSDKSLHEEYKMSIEDRGHKEMYAERLKDIEMIIKEK